MARHLDEDKRASILDAARTIFGEAGYQQTTVKRIAEAAGIAQGTLYTYFGNKEELFIAAVETIWQSVFARLRTVREGTGSFVEKLLGFTDYGFELLTEIHPLLRGMFSEANRRELLFAPVDRLCESIVGFFSDARDQGDIAFSVEASDRLRRFNLRMMVSGVLFRASLSPPEALAGELAEIREGFLIALRERVSGGEA